MSISGEALVGLSSQVVKMGFGFAGFILFARVLGPVGLGGYLVVLAAGRLVSQVADGVADGIQKRVSEANANERELLGTGIIFHVGLIAATAILLVLTEGYLQQYINAPRISLSILSIVATMGAFSIAQQFYQGLGYPGYASWIDTFRSVVTTLSQVVLVLSTDLGSFALVLGICIANGASALVAVGLARTWPAVPRWEIVDSVWQFARWSVPKSVVADGYNRFDVLIIGAWVGNSAAAFYGAGLRLVQPAAFVASSIGLPLLVRTSGRHSRGMDVTNDLKNALSYTTILSIPMFFGALAMPTALVSTVFGTDFSAAGPALIALALYQVVQTFSSPFTSIFEGTDQIDILFKIILVTFVVDILLVLALVGPYGTLGVIGATILADTFRVVVYEILTYRWLGRVVFPRLIILQIFSAVLMGGGVKLVADQINITGWLPLLAVVSLGCVLYAGTLIVLSNDLRKTVTAIASEHFGVTP